MPLNRNQKIFLFCPCCSEDVGKTIQWLYDNPVVHCNTGEHELSEQANEVVAGLKNAERILELDIESLKGPG